MKLIKILTALSAGLLLMFIFLAICTLGKVFNFDDYHVIHWILLGLCIIFTLGSSITLIEKEL